MRWGWKGEERRDDLRMERERGGKASRERSRRNQGGKEKEQTARKGKGGGEGNEDKV